MLTCYFFMFDNLNEKWKGLYFSNLKGKCNIWVYLAKSVCKWWMIGKFCNMEDVFCTANACIKTRKGAGMGLYSQASFALTFLQHIYSFVWGSLQMCPTKFGMRRFQIRIELMQKDLQETENRNEDHCLWWHSINWFCHVASN